jgi:Aldehyde dehydrogenase family
MTPSLRRARILDRFKTILWERADQLAEVISAEHGKTHDDAKGEVTRGLEVVEFAVSVLHLLKDEITENVGTGVDSHSLRQPLGRGRGHHTIQLPRHGADVDVPGRHRLRQLLYSQTIRARPVSVVADR